MIELGSEFGNLTSASSMKCFPSTFNEISVQVNITTKIDKDIGIPRIPENLEINMNSIYEEIYFG